MSYIGPMTVGGYSMLQFLEITVSMLHQIIYHLACSYRITQSFTRRHAVVAGRHSCPVSRLQELAGGQGGGQGAVGCRSCGSKSCRSRWSWRWRCVKKIKDGEAQAGLLSGRLGQERGELAGWRYISTLIVASMGAGECCGKVF